MAFFKKLKEKLFKSSSKIDEGLEAIVSDGGEVDNETEAQAVAEQEAAFRAEADRLAAEAEADRKAEEARAEADRRDVKRKEAELLAAEELRLAAERAAAEQARLAAEAAAAEEARQREEAAVARAAAEAAARAAEKKRDAEAAQTAAEAKAQAREAEQEAHLAAEEARAKAEAERRQADEADKARLAEEARRAEEAAVEAARQAEEAEKSRAAEAAAADAKATADAAEEARLAQQAARVAREDAPKPLLQNSPDAPEQKRGFLNRIMGRAAPAPVMRRVLDDDMLEQLEELLISADMGVDTALRVTANMAEGRLGKKLSVAEIKGLMATEIARIMEPVAKPLPLYPKTPQVVLVVGVNGSGKTTTIGKLASQFRAAGKSVVIAAGDTFRAAAVEQLQVWGERAGVPVMTAPQGSDPASLVFDAMTKAEADGADLLMIDTAGRLQNRSDLMEELAKIVRVIRKKDETAPHNTLLVLDATTGQNAINQVKVFQEISDVSGLVMTKLDGTAKGGVLVALADKFGLPIHAIGVGEQIDDLSPFDPEEFANALVGIDG